MTVVCGLDRRFGLHIVKLIALLFVEQSELGINFHATSPSSAWAASLDRRRQHATNLQVTRPKTEVAKPHVALGVHNDGARAHAQVRSLQEALRCKTAVRLALHGRHVGKSLALLLNQ